MVYFCFANIHISKPPTFKKNIKQMVLLTPFLRYDKKGKISYLHFLQAFPIIYLRSCGKIFSKLALVSGLISETAVLNVAREVP